MHGPKQISLAVGLTVSTVCSWLPGVWLYSAKEHCSKSVLACSVHSISAGEGAYAGGCLEGHNHCPAESPNIEAGDWDAFLFKNFMELSLPECQKPAPHGGAGEEGEGREL